MLKKLIAAVLSALMLFSLCSCGFRGEYEALLDDLVGKVNVSEETGSVDTEAALRDKLEEYSEGNTVWFRYSDYDGDGKSEAFAFAGKVTAEYMDGVLWYVSEDYAAELNKSGKWKSPEIISADGTDFLFAENYDDGLTYVFGVENSKVYEAAISGMFTGLKYNGGKDFTAEFTTYDYYDDEEKSKEKEPTTKVYWFYIDGGEFHEYGADDSLKRADLRKYPTASDIMDEIYKSGLTAPLLEKYYSGADEETLEYIADEAGYFDSIMLRENGIINLNFYGAYEDRFYITFKIDGSDAKVIDCGRGFYLPAAVESIATYPKEE